MDAVAKLTAFCLWWAFVLISYREWEELGRPTWHDLLNDPVSETDPADTPTRRQQ